MSHPQGLYSYNYKFAKEDVKRFVEEVIDRVKEHAVPFGGYVRDLVADVEPLDLDLWVFGDFQELLLELLSHYDLRLLNTGNRDYPFAVHRFYISNMGMTIHVDFIVSKEFPVNDFDVNCLILRNGVDSKIMAEPSTGLKTEDLLKAIGEKKARILSPDLKKIILGGISPYINIASKYHFSKRRNQTTQVGETFIWKGYTILFPKPSTTQSPSNDEEYVLVDASGKSFRINKKTKEIVE